MDDFTPGPWTVYTEGHNLLYPGIDAVDGGTIIVYGTGDDDSGGVRERLPHEWDANARLIAAATGGGVR